MADLKYLNFSADREVRLDVGAFVSLVKGAAITSLAIGADYIEFGLSDALNLRIDIGNNVTIIPTTNKGDSPPVRLSIIADSEIPTAELVETRIHALRQIYAINLLVDAGREEDIEEAFRSKSPPDFEKLIDESDKLLINSASTGSFWLTLAARSTAAWKSLTAIAPLFLDEGRQAVLERVRAKTELTKLEVIQKRNDISLQKANAVIALYSKVEKIRDPNIREAVRKELIRSFEATAEVLPFLPPPEEIEQLQIGSGP